MDEDTEEEIESSEEINEDVKELPTLNFGNLPPIQINLNQAPPIPAELIQPTPARIVIANPTITIQKTSNQQVNNLMKGNPTQIVNQPIVQVTTQPLIEKPIVNDLDSMLIKKESETRDVFNMRSVYAKVAMSVFQGKINPATAILLGQMATNKAVYGLTYPEDSDRVIRYINEQIMANY